MHTNSVDSGIQALLQPPKGHKLLCKKQQVCNNLVKRENLGSPNQEYIYLAAWPPFLVNC